MSKGALTVGPSLLPVPGSRQVILGWELLATFFSTDKIRLKIKQGERRKLTTKGWVGKPERERAPFTQRAESVQVLTQSCTSCGVTFSSRGWHGAPCGTSHWRGSRKGRVDGFLTWNSRRGAHPTTSPLSGTLTSWSSSPTLMSGCGAVPETEGAPGASVFTLHFPLLSRGPPPTHQPGTALAPVCQGGVGVGDKGGRTRPQHQSQAPGSVWCTGGLPGGVREERTVGGKQESQPRGRDTGPVNCLVFPRRGTQRGMSKHTSEALRLCIYLTIACTRLKALGPGVGVGGGAQRASACCQARCRRALWFDLGRPLSLS